MLLPIAALTTFVALLWPDPQPHYQGHPLSWWISPYINLAPLLHLGFELSTTTLHATLHS